MSTPEWILVTLKVIETLKTLDVNYAVCGSTASIMHGVVRTTIDADLIADLKPEHVAPFVSACQAEFYVEPDAIHDALATRTSFNLIHQGSMFKIDVFIPKARTFDEAQLAHRVEKIVARDPERTAWITSAEDIILAKLEWFRMGDQVSERQWRDVLGVLRVQKERVDIGYMRNMAKTLGVSDLLEHALEEAAK